MLFVPAPRTIKPGQLDMAAGPSRSIAQIRVQQPDKFARSRSAHFRRRLAKQRPSRTTAQGRELTEFRGGLFRSRQLGWDQGLDTPRGDGVAGDVQLPHACVDGDIDGPHGRRAAGQSTKAADPRNRSAASQGKALGHRCSQSHPGERARAAAESEHIDVGEPDPGFIDNRIHQRQDVLVVGSRHVDLAIEHPAAPRQRNGTGFGRCFDAQQRSQWSYRQVETEPDHNQQPGVLPMLSFSAARERLLRDAEPLSESEVLPLDALTGRIAAERIVAPAAVPAFANSAMDGYAVRSTDFDPEPARIFEQIGTSWAGRPFAGTLGRGQCVRIFTGAAMPAGADAVVIQENAEVEGNGVRFSVKPEPGAWVRPAGGDFAGGQVLVEPGTRLGPFHHGLLAAAGLTHVRVVRQLRVALLASGDELVQPGTPLAPGEIYDSNTYLLSALLQRLPVAIVERGVVPDDPEVIDRALLRCMRSADVILTCGGASVGDADYMHGAIERLGHVDFWKIAMRPGKPLIHGRLGAAWYLGLPGNPVSAAITFIELGQPLLLALCGASPQPPLRVPARLATRFERDTERTDFARVRLDNRDGELWAQPITDQGSARISSLTDAHGLMVLEGPPRTLDAGERVNVEIFPELASH